MGERNYQKKILPVTTTETLSVSLLPFSWLLWLDLLRAFPPRASADTDASNAWTEKSERGGKEKEEEEEEFFTPLVTIVCLYRRRRLLSLSSFSSIALTSTPSTKKTSATVAEDAKPWCGSGVGADDEAQAGSISLEEGKKKKAMAPRFEPAGPSGENKKVRRVRESRESVRELKKK